MKLEDARKLCEEVIERYGISHCDYQEIRKDGEIKLVHLTLNIKIDSKVLTKKT